MTSELATTNRAYSLPEIMTISENFFRSGFFDSAKTASHAFAKILAGQELGLGPLASMSQIHIFQGKVELSATLLGALIKKSGKYDYKIVTTTDTECVADFFENTKNGKSLLGRMKFDEADAKKAELLTKAMWKKHPRDMFRSRCLSAGARTYTPDVFIGIGGAAYVFGEVDPESEVQNDFSEPTPIDTPKASDPPKALEQKAATKKQYIEAIKEVAMLVDISATSTDEEKKSACVFVAQVLGLNQVPEKLTQLTHIQATEFINRFTAAQAQHETFEVESD